MQPFYCRKCDRQTISPKSLDDAVWNHEFCAVCGTAYNQSIRWFPPIDDQTYKKCLELFRQFYGEQNKCYFDLISMDVRLFGLYCTESIIPDVLIKNLKNSEYWKEQISTRPQEIYSFFTCFVFQGYFLWFAEQVINNKKIKEPQTHGTDLIRQECLQLGFAVYEDINTLLWESQDCGIISNDTAAILCRFSMQSKTYFDSHVEMKRFEEIYPYLWQSCFLSVAMGYAMALVDAKYRG